MGRRGFLLLGDKVLGIGETGPHIVHGEARVILKQFLDVRVDGKFRQHQLDRNPGAFDDRVPDKHVGVPRNSLCIRGVRCSIAM